MVLYFFIAVDGEVESLTTASYGKVSSFSVCWKCARVSEG